MTLLNRSMGFAILTMGMVADYHWQAIEASNVEKLILVAVIGTAATGVRL